MKFESGVHRVQRVPETESQGRVHTSAITVAVLPEAEEIDFELNPAAVSYTHLNISVSVSKTQLFRAKEKLRKIYLEQQKKLSNERFQL